MSARPFYCVRIITKRMPCPLAALALNQISVEFFQWQCSVYGAPIFNGNFTKSCILELYRTPQTIAAVRTTDAIKSLGNRSAGKNVGAVSLTQQHYVGGVAVAALEPVPRRSRNAFLSTKKRRQKCTFCRRPTYIRQKTRCGRSRPRRRTPV